MYEKAHRVTSEHAAALTAAMNRCYGDLYVNHYAAAWVDAEKEPGRCQQVAALDQVFKSCLVLDEALREHEKQKEKRRIDRSLARICRE